MTVYTIGHSNHSFEYFLGLLQRYSVSCVADVRSHPVSRFLPHFSKTNLQRALTEHGIAYEFFGMEFGARRTEPEVLDGQGRVDFEKVRAMPFYLSGIARLEVLLAKGEGVALLCAEADPLACHRFGMVAVHLAELGMDVGHILKDGTMRSQEEMEEVLLQKYAARLPQVSLFRPEVTREERLAGAYRLQNEAIGWKK